MPAGSFTPRELQVQVFQLQVLADSLAQLWVPSGAQWHCPPTVPPARGGSMGAALLAQVGLQTSLKTA